MIALLLEVSPLAKLVGLCNLVLLVLTLSALYFLPALIALATNIPLWILGIVALLIIGAGMAQLIVVLRPGKPRMSDLSLFNRVLLFVPAIHLLLLMVLVTVAILASKGS
ncbi:MAG: hypothetical protein KTR24_16490 [Saprospiraceae bacterium]|nr:hypothetical protein [Saprospiraceae bacterium]